MSQSQRDIVEAVAGDLNDLRERIAPATAVLNAAAGKLLQALELPALDEIGKLRDEGDQYFFQRNAARQQVETLRTEIGQLKKVVAAMRAQLKFPIGQGRDDCTCCYGIGLVGTDGAACECVRYGGKPKPLDEWMPIGMAPRDGTEICVLSGEDEVFVRWTDERRCAGEGPNSYFGPGWEDAEVHFIADASAFTHWKPIPKPEAKCST